MLMHLAERLEVPLRECNRLLLSAGFAPVFKERSLEHPDLAGVRRAIDQVLAGHEPYPALAIDRHWMLVAANKGVAPLLVGASPSLLQPPANVLRLSLHPDGLAPRIANLAQGDFAGTRDRIFFCSGCCDGRGAARQYEMTGRKKDPGEMRLKQILRFTQDDIGVWMAPPRDKLCAARGAVLREICE